MNLFSFKKCLKILPMYQWYFTLVPLERGMFALSFHYCQESLSQLSRVCSSGKISHFHCKMPCPSLFYFSLSLSPIFVLFHGRRHNYSTKWQSCMLKPPRLGALHSLQWSCSQPGWNKWKDSIIIIYIYIYIYIINLLRIGIQQYMALS